MLRRLADAGQLPPLTDTMEWKVLGEESVPRPPKGYVVSFVASHERDFSVLARRFIQAVLYEYGLQLHHLNPNSIQQMAAFEATCGLKAGSGVVEDEQRDEPRDESCDVPRHPNARWSSRRRAA
jgi:hypothetical protein